MSLSLLRAGDGAGGSGTRPYEHVTGRKPVRRATTGRPYECVSILSVGAGHWPARRYEAGNGTMRADVGIRPYDTA